MNEMQSKILCFRCALLALYSDEEDREHLGKIEFGEDVTEDFTAMLLAMFTIFKSISQNDKDLLEFTHVLNTLAVMYIQKKEEPTNET